MKQDEIIHKDYLSQETLEEVIYKDHDNAVLEPEPAFTQLQADSIAYALALVRNEVEAKLAPLREQIAALEGKVAEQNGMITVMLKVFQTKDTDKPSGIIRP
jgi:hypothetical protein